MDFYTFFFAPYEGYDAIRITLEAVATLFGILSVYFSVKKHIAVYPTGIISTLIYIYLFISSGLLGDSIINIYYSVMSVYGWILWSKNTETSSVHVSFATKKDWLLSILIFILGTIFVGIVYLFKGNIDHFLFPKLHPSTVHHLDWANYLDIVTTSVFLVGMWLMAKQKIDNWIFWIIGDFICIPMCIYKGLGITSLQYIIFTIMAFLGFFEWKKTFKNQEA